MIGRDLLSIGLLPFAHAVADALSEDQLAALKRAIRIIHHAVNPQETLPDFMDHVLSHKESDPINAYNAYYREEQELNMKLCNMVDNLAALYGGKNNLRAQLGCPLDGEYTDLSQEEAIPLGPEHQDLVNSFLNQDADASQRYANTRGVIRQIRDAFYVVKTSESEKRSLQKLTAENLRILRTILHNRKLLASDESGERKRTEVEACERELLHCQQALVQLGILHAVMPLLNSSSDQLSREAFGTLSNLVAGGSKQIQDAFMAQFLGSRQDPFFACIRQRMTQSEEALRERRILISAAKDKERRKTLALLKSDQKKVNSHFAQGISVMSDLETFQAHRSKQPAVPGFHRRRSAVPSRRQDMTFADLRSTSLRTGGESSQPFNCAFESRN